MDQLKGFYLTSLFSEGCTLPEALDLLREQYYEVCSRTGESPHRFEFEIEGTPEGPIHFNLNQVPFWQALSHLCALAGMKLESRGPPVLIVEVPESSGPITRLFKVPPDFPTAIARDQVDDPFEAEHPASDVDTGLRKRGILKGGESSAAYTPRTSTLIARGTVRDQHRVNSLVELEIRPQVMLQMNVQIIDVPEGTQAAVGAFSEVEAKKILADLLAKEGTALIGSPSVAARPGSPARVMIGGNLPAIDASGATVHVGHQFEFSGSLTGFLLENQIGHTETEAAAGQPGVFERRKSTSSFTLESGDWFIMRSERKDGTGSQYLFYSPETVDAIGRPAGGKPTP